MSGESKDGVSHSSDRPDAYTYMMRCGDGSLYTGWTYDLQKRVMAHNLGKGAKYTKSRLPVELVYYERFTTKEEAMSREYAIKRLTRSEKLKLIELAGNEIDGGKKE